MPQLLTSGCMLTCKFGSDPMPFNALDLPGKPLVDGMPTATVLEIVPDDNVPSFVMCACEDNPEVQAATDAAEGVLTPMPCEPVILDPWEPGSITMLFDGAPLATIASTCMCAWGGEISVVAPGQLSVADEG
jgi:hypothetical protein